MVDVVITKTDQICAEISLLLQIIYVACIKKNKGREILGDSPTPDEVRLWLEWAGLRIMSLPISTKPDGFRTSMPEYLEDIRTAYGYTGIRLRIPAPSSTEIPLMDEINTLVLIIPNQLQRRVIQARALINPRSGAYMNTWTKIAHMVHLERRRVKVLHERGLGIIALGITNEQVIKIRAGIGDRKSSFGPSLST